MIGLPYVCRVFMFLLYMQNNAVIKQSPSPPGARATKELTGHKVQRARRGVAVGGATVLGLEVEGEKERCRSPTSAAPRGLLAMGTGRALPTLCDFHKK